MIKTGQYQSLIILRHTPPGLFLGDDQAEEVLLPNKYMPEDFAIGDSLDVFVYRDHEDRKIATTLHPKIKLHEFAFLKVSAVTEIGAFMDWGLEKDLLVPFNEQQKRMEEGRWYVVYLDMDEKTDRLYGSNRLNRHLSNDDLKLTVGEEVDILTTQKTDMGFNVIVNQKHKGLVFDNEIFKELRVGEGLKGYVKKIRTDNKLDISLQPLGYNMYSDKNSQKVMDALTKSDGFLEFTDKSSPEEIYSKFGMSKKAFKKSLGALYKARKITLEKKGIRLVV